MSQEIQLQTVPPQSDLTAYAVVRNLRGEAYNTDSLLFETFVDADQTAYAITLTEQGTDSGFYAGSFPTSISNAGTYNVVAFAQLGGSPLVNDTIIGQGAINWDGSAETSTSGALLTTLAYLKEFMKLEDDEYGSTPPDDDLLTAMLTAATTAIQQYCYRDFVVKDYSEHYNLDDYQYRLTLKNYPITSLSQVTIYPYDVSPTIVSGDDFIIAKYGTIAYKPTATTQLGYFPPGFQSVLVEYTAGFTTIPADIQLATAMVVSRLYYQAGRNTIYLSEKLGDYQYTLAKEGFGAITGPIADILSSYKVHIL